jgi:hypothetical protein
MDAIKQRIDELMGKRAGDGCGPTEAAAVIADEFNFEMTPREVWNLWIGEDD